MRSYLTFDSELILYFPLLSRSDGRLPHIRPQSLKRGASRVSAGILAAVTAGVTSMTAILVEHLLRTRQTSRSVSVSGQTEGASFFPTAVS